jgi:hypothetical protein
VSEHLDAVDIPPPDDVRAARAEGTVVLCAPIGTRVREAQGLREAANLLVTEQDVTILISPDPGAASPQVDLTAHLLGPEGWVQAALRRTGDRTVGAVPWPHDELPRMLEIEAASGPPD